MRAKFIRGEDSKLALGVGARQGYKFEFVLDLLEPGKEHEAYTRAMRNFAEEFRKIDPDVIIPVQEVKTFSQNPEIEFHSRRTGGKSGLMMFGIMTPEDIRMDSLILNTPLDTDCFDPEYVRGEKETIPADSVIYLHLSFI